MVTNVVTNKNLTNEILNFTNEILNFTKKCKNEEVQAVRNLRNLLKIKKLLNIGFIITKFENSYKKNINLISKELKIMNFGFKRSYIYFCKAFFLTFEFAIKFSSQNSIVGFNVNLIKSG